MPSEVYGKATTTYIGGYYEWIGSTNTQTKYYTAGGSTVAMRKGSTLNYLLADHLGSTYATVDTLSGRKLVQRLYMPWSEDRNPKGTLPTTVKYTGQQESGLGGASGLYDYGARGWLI